MKNNYFADRKIRYKLVKIFLINIGNIWYYIRGESINKRLFFIFPWYQVGGGERVHSQIVSCLNKKKSCVIFSDYSKDYTFYKTFQENAEIVDLKRNFYKNSVNLSYRWIILGYISSMINNSVCPITFGSGTPFYYELLPLLNNKVKTIDLVHQFGSGIEIFSLPYVPRIDKRIVITKTLYYQFQELYKINYLDDYLPRISIIENGIKIEKEYPIKKLNKKIRVLFVSRNSPEKRPHLIGKIAYQCACLGINAEFICIGDINFDIAPEHLQYCTVLGPIYNTDTLFQEYRQSDILLIVSKYEGFPMVIMESMGMGVIPISTDVGGISEHIQSGYNGFLIQENEENHIVRSACDILKCLDLNRERMKEMSVICYEYAVENYCIENFCKKYQAIIEEMQYNL